MSFFLSRRIVASASNILPHIPKVNPKWTDPQLTELIQCSSPKEQKSPLLPDAAGGKNLSEPPPRCVETYFVEPLGWMTEVPHQQQGKINCPKCSTKLGSFSWIMG